MKEYSLPIDLSKILEINEDDKINMSDISFPVDKLKQKYAAFIFLRNIKLNAKFDFSGCSYEDKSEFLLLYMTGNINLYIRELVISWVSIIAFKNLSMEIIDSIFTNDEKEKFCHNNEELINEVTRLFISLPLCSISEYRKTTDKKLTNDIEVSYYDKININNFLNMTFFEIFNSLIFFIDGYTPIYYVKYFQMDSPYYKRIISLPFTSIIKSLFDNTDIFIERYKANIDMMINGDNNRQGS